ncbi:MAG: ABC transporter [Flavobacteriales bacterium]|nr:MAG: ABC transporter [Flavobacteriales bacterium]
MLLEIKKLHFSYPDQKELFTNIHLQMDEGKIIAIAGESGCGKSTLLNIIYGKLDWQEGEIIFNERKLLGPKGNLVPGENDMKMVSQGYDLMLYASVEANIGQFISNIDLEEKEEKVRELLYLVGLENDAKRKPINLSGGQQQRVAIARALSVLPKLLILDEPFSNLDFSRKIQLRKRLFDYAKKHNITIIISTHELQEVMPWLDQIIILKEGRLIQDDSPMETFLAPYNHYVSQLFGEVNTLTNQQMKSLNLKQDFVYPHQIILSEEGFKAQVLESRFAGSYFWNLIQINDIQFIMYSQQKIQGDIKVKFKL